MNTKLVITSLALASVLSPAFAANDSLGFYKTQTSLHGDWKLSPATLQQGGSTKKGPANKLLNTDKTAMSFRVIGKGSTVQGSLLPGTVKEMATMYHCDQFNNCSLIEARHYCAKQNQPELVLDDINSTKHKIVMKCDQDSALCNSMADHVHGITHELSGDDNHLKTSYLSFKDGKYSKTSIYHFDRK